MLYIDYCILRQGYDRTVETLRQLLDKKEEAFTRTQPNAIRYDSQKVISSVGEGSAVEDYIMDAERIDAQILEAKGIMEERFALMLRKEIELRKSKDVKDQVFVRWYLDHMPIRKIALQLHYSEDTIWRRRRQIKKSLPDCKFLQQ